jgi:two-component system sensor histidine kinase VicK
VTRIESQTLKLNKTRFNLKEAITSVLEDIKGMPLSNNSDKLKIVYEIGYRSKREDSDLNDADDDNIFITADRDRITQVISNLMSNALKFTNQGLIQIVVDVMEEHRMQGEEELLISVKDTGSGIDPEIFPRLFTKFSSRSFSGTGLGLYISKSIVEAHGGKIWAKNNDDQMNSGSTFYFSLPLSK